jgi:TonB family protein
MADEDLSGEQLLVLVARAVGGPQIFRGDGAADVPDSMRAAFLTGYEAWSNRGSELHDPLPWPPARPQAQSSESLPSPEPPDAISEPIAPKVAARGLRTVQEALDMARERAPFDTPAHRPSSYGTNLEGLTMGELRKLLEDIESRVSRIEPHLRYVTSAGPALSDNLGRREELRKSHGVDSSQEDARAALTEALLAAPTVSDDPFLARRGYLKSTRRVVPDIPAPLLPLVFVAVAPTAPVTVAVASPLASTQADLAAAPVAALSAASEVAADPMPPPVALSAAAVIVPPDQDVSVPPVEPDVFVFRIGNHKITSARIDFRLAMGFVTALALIAGGYTGVLVYHYLHPRYVYAEPEITPPIQPAAETVVQPADPNTGLQQGATSSPRVASAAMTRPSVTSRPARNLRDVARGGETPSKSYARSWQEPQVSIWPPSNQEALRAAAATAATTAAATPPLAAPAGSALAGATNTTPAARQTSQPASDTVYVPSSKMMGYALTAPRPLYPRDVAKGMDGTVVLQVTISKQGNVTNTRTISGPVELHQAALQAVWAWHFRPYLLDGNPTEVTTTVELPFKGQ